MLTDMLGASVIGDISKILKKTMKQEKYSLTRELIMSFFFLVCSLNLFGQMDADINKERIKANNIKEQHTYIFNLQTGDSLLTNIIVYDVNGNFLKDKRYNEKGVVVFKFVAEYNTDSLLHKLIVYDQNGVVQSTTIWEYDEQGNQVDYKQVSPTEGILVHQKRKYNDRGQDIEVLNIERNSDKFFKAQENQYRTDGKLLKTISFNPNGRITVTDLYEYDNNGNEIAIYEVVGRERDLVSTSKYNDKNQRIEQNLRTILGMGWDGKLIFGEGSKATIYVYDKEGNITEERVYEKDELKELTKYYYEKFDI